MINSIRFKDYKAFKGEHQLKIKPITLLIGKNSSGKSSLCRMVQMLSWAVSQPEPCSSLLLNNNEVCLGKKYEDLFTNGMQVGLSFEVYYTNPSCKLAVEYFVNEGHLDRSKYQIDTDVDDEIKTMLLFDTSYIGPIRQTPPYLYTFEGLMKYSHVGATGEHALALLVDSYKTDKKLYEHVSTWFHKHMEGQRLIIDEMPDCGAFECKIRTDGSSYETNLRDVGYGISQLLPVIVESYVENNAITIIEQPALHIHPAAHEAVASRLVESAKQYGKSYIVESHSENILLTFRKLVSDRSNSFSSDDIVIYYVDKDDDGAYLKEITVDENGELSSWPVGVFGESFELVKDILANKQ
jgi:predicted ATPase